MGDRNIFLNISPLDHRYYQSNRELFDRLSNYLSEEANVRYCCLVELSLLKNHVKQFHGEEASQTITIDDILESIHPKEVYREEKKTRHNIRALVNVLKRKVPTEYTHYVHLGATSADILDTAFALRIKDAVIKVVLPLLIELEKHLIDLSHRHASEPQIGRTHGQHAVPISVGFAFSEYCARFGKCLGEITHRGKMLKGKMSGAVGAYNAMSIIHGNPIKFEETCLSDLGIEASEYSNQIVEPEYLLRLLLELNVAFGILANLADDLRNLQRSEIAELSEEFTEGQVGSSTMPQKRNPWNAEHVKSLWKAFSPRVQTFFSDQISEHQRDLSNSASMRFVCEYIAGFSSAASRMIKILARIRINREALQKNLGVNGDRILAEPLYILLALAGEDNAHEIIKGLTLDSEQSGKSLTDLISEKYDIRQKLERMLSKRNIGDLKSLLANPEEYRGMAKEKASTIAARYREIVKKLEKELSL